MTTTRRNFLEVLRGLKTPDDPVDGDCIRWAPTVTEAFVAAGYPAQECVVIGWMDDDVILYVHRATKIGFMVVDCTARQYSPKLPLRWVADRPQYIAGMVEHTGVASVTVAGIGND